jgi:hypothetical protein
MRTPISEQPAFIFQVMPRIALSWTSLGILLLLGSGFLVSAFYQAIHQQAWSIPPELGMRLRRRR